MGAKPLFLFNKIFMTYQKKKKSYIAQGMKHYKIYHHVLIHPFHSQAEAQIQTKD